MGTGAQWSNAGWGNNDAFYTLFNIQNIYLIPTAVQQNNSQEFSFTLYPNPGNGELVVSFGKDATPQNLVVTDVLGQVVFSQKILQIDSNGRLYLDFRRLDQGIYFLNLQYTGKSETKKFSIIR